jgi:hypothetical protein
MAVAAVLGLSAPAFADHNDTHRDALNHNRGNGNTALRQYREHDRMDEKPFLSRAVSWPYRATRSVVRTPIIVGETLSGRRQVIQEDGRVLAKTDRRRSERVQMRDTSEINDGVRYTARRTARGIKSGAERGARFARGAGETAGNVAYSSGRFIGRAGRTIARTPEIIGETLSGERKLIGHEGEPGKRVLVQNKGRGQRFYRSAD